jgi:hypothetical protein
MIDKQFSYIENATSNELASTSKFPISTSEVKIELPGYTGEDLVDGIEIVEIDLVNKILYLKGNWLNRRALENTYYRFQLRRGNLRKNMQFVKLYHGYASDSCLRWSSEAIWEEETDTWDCDQESKEKVTKVVLDNHVTSADLFDFIGLSGAPTAIGKANFSLYSQNMNPPNSHSHSFAQEKIVGLGLNEYGIKMSWINSADVNQNVLRWRAVPRVKRSTTLHYTVENAGQYSSLPVPTVKSEWGSGETISLVGTIVSVSVDNGGEFVGTPLLTASYPGAFGASFSVSMSGNSVAAVNVISGGIGFNKAPSFSFSGATVVSTPSFSTLLGIADVRTESKGYDYVDSPTISLQGGSGAGGSISAITEVSNDGMVDYVRVIDGGIGYVNRSQLTFSGGGGVGARGYVNVVNDTIASVTITDNGYGYTSAPTVGVTGAGASASLLATVSLYDDWNYVNIDPSVSTYTLSGLDKYAEYEWQLYSSTHKKENLNSFSPSLKFKFF